jgi:hypothetical protein
MNMRLTLKLNNQTNNKMNDSVIFYKQGVSYTVESLLQLSGNKSEAACTEKIQIYTFMQSTSKCGLSR